MSIPNTAASFSQDMKTPPASVSKTRPDAVRKARMMRRYRIRSLREDGSVHETENIGPATPVFEKAFSAFARGTLIKTTTGPVAVEDLEPGMMLITAEHGPSQLLWIGSMTLVPRGWRRRIAGSPGSCRMLSGWSAR